MSPCSPEVPPPSQGAPCCLFPTAFAGQVTLGIFEFSRGWYYGPGKCVILNRLSLSIRNVDGSDSSGLDLNKTPAGHRASLQVSLALGAVPPTLHVREPLQRGGCPGYKVGWSPMAQPALLGCPPWRLVPSLESLSGPSCQHQVSCGETLWEVDWPGRLGIEMPNFQSPNQDTHFGRDSGSWGQWWL